MGLFWLCVIFLLDLSTYSYKVEYINKIFIKIDVRDRAIVENGLKLRNISFSEEIFPSLYVYEYTEWHSKEIPLQTLQEIKTSFHGKIHFIEQVRNHIDNLKKDPELPMDVSHSDDEAVRGNALLVCQHNYDTGVEDAWSQNYTGRGVVIAVTDIGFDIDIPDLVSKFNKELSFNAVNNNTDITPEQFPSYQESAASADHGNRCAGLIVAEKDNDICGAGIAYGAKIAGIKVFELVEYHWTISHSELATAKALSYRLQDIHIFSNSWLYITNFSRLPHGPKEAIKRGIKKGRKGKGSIYVFPAGPIAEGFANSIYVITISSIGRMGTKPQFVQLSASALTSTYGEGSRFNASYMITTSHNRNNCTRDFKGVSASTAMASAIVGLALEANPNLNWRDVQHILVEASEHKGLEQSNFFKTNKAHKHYHNEFGFGLLNASKVVKLAKHWQTVGVQIKHTESSNIKRNDRESSNHQHSFYARHKYISRARVDIPARSCITKLEHVVVKLSFNSVNENELEIGIRSPLGTDSILMASGQSLVREATKRENIEFKSVPFWGENPKGTWTLFLVQERYLSGKFGVLLFELTIYGTKDNELLSEVCNNDENVIIQHQDNPNPNSKPEYVTPPENTKKNEKTITEVIVPIASVIFIICVITIYYKKYKSRRNNASTDEESGENVSLNDFGNNSDS